jgi:peptide/nickel transport system permease protein
MSTMFAASPSELLMRAATRAAGRRRSVTRRRLTLIVGLAMLGIAILAAVLAPVLVSASPTTLDPLHPLAPPLTSGHLLGTDQYGRDLLARILYGGRIDLAIAFGATSVTLVGGTFIGLVAGYLGGKVDSFLMRLVDLFFAFPFLVLIIGIVAMLGRSIRNMFVAIWITSWVAYARIQRAQTVVAKKQQYVLAARALGYGRLRVMFRHILPNTASAVIIFSMVDAVGNIILAASLGFLGLGAQPPSPEWGTMIADGQNYILSSWWLATIPGLAVVFVGVAFSLVGDGLIAATGTMARTNIDDGDIFIGEFASGAICSVQSSFVTVGNYPGIEVRVYGSEGAAIARRVEEFGICETLKMARPDDVEFRDIEVPARYYPPGGSPRESWRTLYYANLTANFAGEVLGEIEGNEGDFDDGLWVQEVINAVEISHHERRWVSLPLDSARPATEG